MTLRLSKAPGLLDGKTFFSQKTSREFGQPAARGLPGTTSFSTKSM
jgi:hypothetical protein